MDRVTRRPSSAPRCSAVTARPGSPSALSSLRPPSCDGGSASLIVPILRGCDQPCPPPLRKCQVCAITSTTVMTASATPPTVNSATVRNRSVRGHRFAARAPTHPVRTRDQLVAREGGASRRGARLPRRARRRGAARARRPRHARRQLRHGPDGLARPRRLRRRGRPRPSRGLGRSGTGGPPSGRPTLSAPQCPRLLPATGRCCPT